MIMAHESWRAEEQAVLVKAGIFIKVNHEKVLAELLLLIQSELFLNFEINSLDKK